MTTPRDPEALLAAYLADGMNVLPDRVAQSVLAEVHRTRQRPVFGARASGSTFRTALAAAAVVAVLVVGGMFYVAGDPSPSAEPSAGASQTAVLGPSASPSSSAEVPSPPVAQSLELTWTKVALDEPLGNVAWLGDRFVLIDGAGVVSTSSDGLSWQILQPGDPDPGYAELLRADFVSWGNDVVGWGNPDDGRPTTPNQPPETARDILRIIRPPAAATESTPFKGRINSIGIGPVGIVAQVHSHLDWDAWVASKLGDDWVSRYEEVSFKDGILEITMKRGRGLKVVWADEGFELGDFQDAGFGWYSPDGVAWTAIPAPAWFPDQDSGLGFPTGFGDVVGVSDGFIARGVDTGCSSDDGCAGMWHSPDGLTWRNIGNVVNGSEGQLLSWMGGALVTDGVGRFDFWTSQGSSELPMAAELPAAWKQAEGNAEESSLGPLGFVTARKADSEILFTRDGVAWDIQAMPAEMDADWPQTMGGLVNVVVGEGSVLVVLRSGTYEEPITSLWLGTPVP